MNYIDFFCGEWYNFVCMATFDFDCEYFNIADTLTCGQVFRFKQFDKGFLINSADKIAYVYTLGNKTIVECDDENYFFNYFDLNNDYQKIAQKATSFNIPLLSRSVEKCKGLRILKQNKEEMIFSFLISQNNNIPRIKSIIEKICSQLGDKMYSPWGSFFSFPSAQKIASCSPSFFRSLGAGYRDTYLVETAKSIEANGISNLENLPDNELKKQLLKFKGVGGKVADCILLFAFNKTNSFPVDTWIEKVYREDFGGVETNRDKICKYFVGLFGNYSGYIQQYLFHGKRLGL